MLVEFILCIRQFSLTLQQIKKLIVVSKIEELLKSMEPITLAEMGSVKLMNRTDTKFVTTLPQLERLLAMAHDDYYAQEIDGERNMLYDTTYFDTNDFAMYREHQCGHTGRQKIRFRTYVSSQLQFMEIKTKNNHGRTKKKRIEVGDMDLEDETKRDFISQHLKFNVDTLVPHMHNFFHRITLVNKGKTERLTIDTALNFHNCITDTDRDMGPLVIVELKRDGLVYSPVLNMLRELRIKPHGFSKYCMGSALTNDQLPVNIFKYKLRDVARILNAV